MPDDKIYTIGLMLVRDNAIGKTENPRTIGWFETREEAEDLILRNAGDMFECGFHNTAVIEEISSGVYAIAQQISWYHATYTAGVNDPDVVRIEQPDWAKHICNFSMG